MNLRTRYSFFIIFTAALLLGTVIAVQFVFMNRGVINAVDALRNTEERNSDLRLEMEKQTVMIQVQRATTIAERIGEQQAPDKIYSVITSLAKENEHLAECGILFVSDYFGARTGSVFLPVAVRHGDSIINRDDSSDQFNYYERQWFQKPATTGNGYWTKPYNDHLSGVPVQTFAYPLHDSSDKLMGVMYADLPMWWLESMNQQSDALVASYRYGQQNMMLVTGIFMVLGIVILIIICWRAAQAYRKFKIVTDQRLQMENELHVASEIQMGMIPKDFSLFNGRSDVDVYASLKPAKAVGGDLYDFFLRDDKLFFCIGDVSGKGIPASLMMAVTRSLFRTEAQHTDNPECIVSAVNNSMVDMNEQGLFVTFWVGVLDLRTGYLDYCNAGHDAPMLLPSYQWLDVKPNLALGVMGGFMYQGQSIDLQPDTMIFLYTDGLNEAENAKHEQFGTDRMKQVTSSEFTSVNGGKAFIAAMTDAVHEFVDGTEQSDDLTMMAVCYHGSRDSHQ